MEKTINKKQIISELWRRGVLKWKLNVNQSLMYDLFYSSDIKRHVWVLARRSGKSYCLVTIAIEHCLRNPNHIVKVLAPTKDQMESNIEPIFQKILDDCPEDIKPTYFKKKYTYMFKNGAQIQLAGTDKGHCERLRGGDAHLVIIDEAGFCDNLEYNVTSILSPTTLMTKGKMIFASTPPRESEHDFNMFVEMAQANGTLVKKTIYDNPMLDADMLKSAIEECGGEKTESFLREYMCVFIKDSKTSVLPEFDEALKTEIVKDWPRPPHFDSYVSMDVGFKDLTVVLFGYYDFRASKLIIESEIVRSGQDLHLPVLTNDILKMEEYLWTNVYSGEVQRPVKRVSDIDYIVMSELSKYSGGSLNFVIADKDNKEAAINNLRVMLAQKRIIINPRCVTLIQHLENVKRKKQDAHAFARSPDNGHYDAVDACIYLSRAVNYNRNPYPSTYGYEQRDLYINNPDAFKPSQLQAYQKIFNVKTKRR